MSTKNLLSLHLLFPPIEPSFLNGFEATTATTNRSLPSSFWNWKLGCPSFEQNFKSLESQVPFSGDAINLLISIEPQRSLSVLIKTSLLSLSHSLSNTHTHIYAYAGTRTHTCLLKHTHMRTHMHTHTFALFSFVWQCCALVKNGSMRRNEKLVWNGATTTTSTST